MQPHNYALNRWEGHYERLTVRLRAEDLATLQQEAARAGLPLSSFIRFVLLRARRGGIGPPPAPPLAANMEVKL